MTADRPQISPTSSKQKVIGVVIILVFLFLAYMVYGMFSGKKKPEQDIAMVNKAPGTTHAMSATAPNAAQPMQGMQPNAQGNMQPQMNIPQPAQMPKPPAQTEREAQLMRLQQETEAKYLTAVNELQMLKIEKDIAETNKAIMAAKFETVQSQKGIVDTLTGKPEIPPGGNYGAGLVNQTGVIPGGPTPTAPTPVAQPQENYVAVSVSQLEYRWSAVLGYGGKLYSVYIGDVLPADGSKVVAIDKSGVTLEKDGTRKKISLVSII